MHHSSSTAHIPPNTITGLILAGGQGTRMNNQDKGWVMLDDQPLIEHGIRCLSPQVGHLIISCNRYQSKYQSYSYPIVSDGQYSHSGPLAGIYAGLKHCHTPWMALLPVDCPAIPSDHVLQLASRCDNDTTIVMIHAHGRLQPLFSLIRRDCIHSLSEFLASGDRKVQQWMRSLPHQRVEVKAQTHHYRNINTQEELVAWKGK